MFRRRIIRALPAVAPRRIPARGICRAVSRPTIPSVRQQLAIPRCTQRFYAAPTTADEKIEELTELYGTARDEFEIAAEETESNTVYAEEDRNAAREELNKLLDVYKGVVEGPDPELGNEVKQRIGQRIRELENAVQAMEQMAQNQD